MLGLQSAVASLVSYMLLANIRRSRRNRAYRQSWDRFGLSLYRIDAGRIASVL